MRIDINRVPGLPQYDYVSGRPTMIVMHETANSNSTLDNERNYMISNWTNAFYHYIVDADRAVEVADPNFIAWGAGPNANARAIHIELIRNTDFSKAYSNYIELARILASRFGIQKVFNVNSNGIVTHKWVSDNLGGTDHTDPDSWITQNGVSMNKFKNDIEQGGTEMISQSGVDHLSRMYLGRPLAQQQANDLMSNYTFDQAVAWFKALQEAKDNVAKASKGQLKFHDFMIADFRDKIVDARTMVSQSQADVASRFYLGTASNDNTNTNRVGKQPWDQMIADFRVSQTFASSIDAYKVDPVNEAKKHLPAEMRDIVLEETS